MWSLKCIINEWRSKLFFSALPFGLHIPASGSHPFLNKSIHWFSMKTWEPVESSRIIAFDAAKQAVLSSWKQVTGIEISLKGKCPLVVFFIVSKACNLCSRSTHTAEPFNCGHFNSGSFVKWGLSCFSLPLLSGRTLCVSKCLIFSSYIIHCLSSVIICTSHLLGVIVTLHKPLLYTWGKPSRNSSTNHHYLHEPLVLKYETLSKEIESHCHITVGSIHCWVQLQLMFSHITAHPDITIT